LPEFSRALNTRRNNLSRADMAKRINNVLSDYL